MSDQALPAQGLKLKRGTGSPVTYTAIPEINSFQGPGGAAQSIDVSDLDSSAVEKIMGLADEGQLTFEINYLPANAVHANLRSDRANRTVTPFQIVFPDDSPATAWTFNAYVTGFAVSGGVNAPVKASVTLEISGSVIES